MSFRILLAIAGISSALSRPLNLASNTYTWRGTRTKIGTAYSNITLVGSFEHSSWAYNWDMYAGGDLPPGVEYCPMLWGPKMYGQWHSAVSNALSSGSNCLLGFNEPDIAEQANMSPKQAARDYQAYITPYAKRAKLVTPSITNGVGEMIGLNWLEKWFIECNGQCEPDAIAIHYYSDSDSADFIDYIGAAISLAQKHGIGKVWITEFQNTGSFESQVAFLQNVLPWLVDNAATERYAYFFVNDQDVLSGTDLAILKKEYTSVY